MFVWDAYTQHSFINATAETHSPLAAKHFDTKLRGYLGYVSTILRKRRQSMVAPWTDQAEDVLDDDVPDKLDSHLDKDEVDDYHLQAGGVGVGALRAQDIEQLPEYALKIARGEEWGGRTDDTMFVAE